MDLYNVFHRMLIGLLTLPFLGIWVIWNLVWTIVYYLSIRKSKIPETTRIEFRGARLRLIFSLVIFLAVFLYAFWPEIWAIFHY